MNLTESVDFVNSIFVGAAVILAALDLRAVYRDGALTGLHVGTAVLMTVWPMCDLVYSFSLHQYTSLSVCAVLATIRGLWLGAVIRFRVYAR